MSRNFNRHMIELDSGFYGKGYIAGMKKALNSHGRKDAGYSTSRFFMGMSSAELDTILERIANEHPKIREDQAKQGLAWLLDVWKTPRGTERKSSPFANRETRALETFDHFELIGFYDYGNAVPKYLPVYRVVGKGASFDYYAGSWQSGVALTIV